MVDARRRNPGPFDDLPHHVHQTQANLAVSLVLDNAMVKGSGVENNGYSLMEIAPSGTISIKGYRKQKTHEWG